MQNATERINNIPRVKVSGRNLVQHGRKQNEVHFNAHRVFHPLDIFSWSADKSIELKRFDYVDDKGDIHKNVDLFKHDINVSYGCGIYSFTKLKL